MLRAAEYDSLTRHSKRPSKFYVGRRLPGVLAEAGLIPTGITTQAINRQAPLGSYEEKFLGYYLRRLRTNILPNLSPEGQHQVAPLLDPNSPEYLLWLPHFSMTWLNVLALGRKPSGSN